MAIKYTAMSFERLARKVKKQVGNIQDEVLIEFFAIGQNGMSHYKQNGAYRDRTKTLRRSCAVGVFKDGRLINKKYLNAYGRKGLESFEAPKKGISLAFVVGAPYARHVENKGYNVYSETIKFLKKEGNRVVRNIIKSKLGK